VSQLNDPNREAVGLAPIWTGAGDPPPPEARQTKTKADETKADEPKVTDEPKAEHKAEPKK
jgi:hypothetical protein